ncbi:hypothetical protein ACFOW4_10555 [Micromonospora sp. GCM10011542]
MTDAARRILGDTDWSGLEHAHGPAYPETPIKLAAAWRQATPTR